ncbi:hypothetical protein MLD38_020158 [Melastoma candidum]|uniref:Uncharacterized protein n=1 Tax=Melastoma candidum TaxID=119954 RepID=A0ACB9QF16_9MYRT|nr:hypothetical protein MLD38_020158 [Melastoma candidum]
MWFLVVYICDSQIHFDVSGYGLVDSLHLSLDSGSGKTVTEDRTGNIPVRMLLGVKLRFNSGMCFSVREALT